MSKTLTKNIFIKELKEYPNMPVFLLLTHKAPKVQEGMYDPIDNITYTMEQLENIDTTNFKPCLILI